MARIDDKPVAPPEATQIAQGAILTQGSSKGLITQSEATTPRVDERKKERAPVVQETSTLDALEAAFSTMNTIGSAVAFGVQDQEVSNRDYDPIARVFELGRPDLLEKAVYADSDADIEGIIEQDYREQKYRDILDNSGWVGTVATAAAGLLDPTLLIPGTGYLGAGSKMYRLAKGAKSGAALGAAALGAQETVLAATQLDRTAEDAVFNAVGGAVFGGIFGGAGGFFSRGNKSQTQAMIDDIMADTDMQIQIKTPADQPPSVGAAGVTLETKVAGFQGKKNAEGIANLNETLIKVMTGPRALRSPVVNGLTSPFATIREYTNDIFSHNFILNKNLRGRETGSTVEADMVIDRGRITRTNTAINNLYLDLAGKQGKAFAGIQAAIGAKRKKNLSWQDFSDELAKAFRRGDQHEIPQIAAAAKLARKDIDDFTKQLQELKILPEGLTVKTAQSWISRRYNQPKIAADRTGANKFRSIIAAHFAKADGLSPTDPSIIERAEETIRRIQGLGDESLQISDLTTHMSTKGGTFTKERVLDIPDEAMEEFLVNDGAGLYSTFMLQASGMIRLQNKLLSKGFDSIQEVRQALRDESEVLVKSLEKQRKAALAGKTGSEAADINKAFDKRSKELAIETDLAIDDINNNTKVILGQFGKTGEHDSKLRVLRKYITMRLLGGVVISSFPDIAMPVFRHGLGETLERGYKPMIKNFRASKAARDDLKHINIGLELESNEILRAITDPDFKLGQTRSEIERVADLASDAFGKVSGISYWNNFHRRLAGQISLGRNMDVAKTFSKTGQLSDDEITRLAALGLEKEDLAAIWGEFQKHGSEVDGSFIANLTNWNQDIARKFGRAILKDADSTILVPGKGDIPLIAQNSEIAKTIFQFKSFLFTATNKILLSGLQRRDKDVAAGLAALVIIGGTTANYKDIIAGRTPEEDFGKFLVNGITNSGVSGVMGEAISTLNPWFKSTRYAGITSESFLLGPSANLASDAFSALAGVVGDTDLKDSDVRRMTRMLPFQNLFYLRAILNHTGD